MPKANLDAAFKEIGEGSVTAVRADRSSLADLDQLYATIQTRPTERQLLTPFG